MNNEEFQKAILLELKSLNTKIDNVDSRLSNVESNLSNVDSRLSNVESNLSNVDSRLSNEISSLKEGQKRIENRQDEIYQVVRAIEHSNQVGRSELDNQNFRIAKVEGKIKKVAKAYNEEIEIDKASNL